MHFHVGSQSATLRKGLSTNIADVGPLSSVRPDMFLERALEGEPPATVPAGIRLLPAMGPHMDDESTTLVEPPMTNLALDRLLAGVCPDVR